MIDIHELLQADTPADKKSVASCYKNFVMVLLWFVDLSNRGLLTTTSPFFPLRLVVVISLLGEPYSSTA